MIPNVCRIVLARICFFHLSKNAWNIFHLADHFECYYKCILVFSTIFLFLQRLEAICMQTMQMAFAIALDLGILDV